jgi:hypothetical protein
MNGADQAWLEKKQSPRVFPQCRPARLTPDENRQRRSDRFKLRAGREPPPAPSPFNSSAS